MTERKELPKDGWAGLKQNWKQDILSGFLVSLLALPLSLGIAKASDFPPIMGLLTAIIGGMLVSILAGSRMTIKGPAAGLIVIVAGAVAELGAAEAKAGGTTTGWQLALGAIVLAAGIQVLFGVLKMGKLSDFFPLTVIHGMLGAIGLIIASKQAHILMGVNPVHAEGLSKGKPLVEPMELFLELPNTVGTLLENPGNQKIFLVGIVCLLIVFGWPMIKNKFLKRIPAPLLVLLVSIPLGIALGLKDIKGGLVHVDNIFDVAGYNVSFAGIRYTFIFIKYVFLFALIGSIESLLTVKAMDMLDPFRRKSDYNRDLIAVGAGNILTGILGGLPMISEVARSSANINNGARTRWGNFFHGFFLLLFVVAAVPVIQLIPNAALAAMLIGVGYKLASPREFMHTLKIGREQLIFLVTTTIIILFTDLLVGVFAGIIIKMVYNWLVGLPLRYTFRPKLEIINDHNERYIVKVVGGIAFSNFMGIKKRLSKLPPNSKILVDLSETRLIDHTGMENLHRYKDEYNADGGNIAIAGLERHRSMSSHQYAGARLSKTALTGAGMAGRAADMPHRNTGNNDQGKSAQ